MIKLLATPRVKGVFIGAILLLILVAFFWRPILVLYHQQQAGKIIDVVASNVEGSDLISYRCFLGQLAESTSPEIDIAINHLTKASKIQEQNAYTAYLLGQAHCLNKEFEKAINFLDETKNNRNKNPNLFIEEGFAYYSLITKGLHSSSEKATQADNEYYTKAIKAFFIGNLSLEQIITSANILFEKRKMNAAFSLYFPLSLFHTLSDKESFHVFLLNKIISPSTNVSQNVYEMPVMTVRESLSIQPEQMFVLNKAEKILINVVAKKPFAVILSEENDAIMLVEFNNDGEYILDLIALDHPPAPTKLEFSIDFQLLAEIVLPNGNDELVTNSIQIFLTKGIHLVSIKLTNDLFTEELDRNGYIYQLTINKIPD